MRRAIWVAALLLAACTPDPRVPRTAWQDGRAQVALEYHGRALAVWAVGDFNDWQPQKARFVERSPEHWVLQLDLPPGRYRYLLRLEKQDGLHLQPDPMAREETRDAQGTRLSVLDLSDAMGDIDKTR